MPPKLTGLWVCDIVIFMESLFMVLTGIGLSAACGFRIFLPLLALSLAGNYGYVHLSSEAAWLSSPAALVALSIATALEVVAYYVPYVDHLLDTITTPTAVVAGTLITANFASGMDPFYKWALALIAGGGAAGLMQGGTVLLRGLSTASTGGLGNFLVATLELGGALALTLLALLLPVVCAIALVAAMIYIIKRLAFDRGKSTGQAAY